jgi:DNA invertase Pin-like site-specific DNA recombinase
MPARTVAYCRVSTEEQSTNGQSLSVQETQLRGWAQMTGRQLDQVVYEVVSGGTQFVKRPEGGKLVAELRKGDVLAVSKLDRFSRNLFDCLLTAQEFQKRGISLFLLDVGASDPVTGNGQSKLFLSMLGAFAEFERDRIRERIKATKVRQRQMGQYSGGHRQFGWTVDADRQLVAHRQFGWTVDADRQLVAVPEEQRAIRRIAELHAQGLSPYKIAADLKERGTPVSHVTIRKIIAGRQGASPVTPEPVPATAAPMPQPPPLPHHAYRPPGGRS